MGKKIPKIVSYLFPTFSNILWMAAFFSVLFLGRGMMNGDGDLGRHLTLGHYILEQGNIPLRDLFSHTLIGQPLTPHEWLSQVLFALVERIFGMEGVILLCALLITFTFWFVFRHVRKLSQFLLPSILVVLLAMYTSVVHWLTRPHLFTFLLLAMWMNALHQLRQGKLRRWWILPVLMLFWANLHGAFIAGFVTWIIYGVGVVWETFWFKNKDGFDLPPHFWRYYLLSGITSFFVTLFNPSGLDLWKTSIGYLGNKYLVDITMEYQSPNFHKMILWPFLIFIVLLIFVSGLNKKRMNSGLLLNTAAWLGMGLYSGRNIPLFAIVAAPLLAEGISDLLDNAPTKSKFLKWFKSLDNRILNVDLQLKGFFWPLISIVIAILGMVLGFRFDFEGLGYAFDPKVFPVEAVNWLEDNPQDGNMFNYFIWGGYLLYRDWPEQRVFIDGQTDFYGEELTRKYMQVIDLQENWEALLHQYQVSWAILPTNEIAANIIHSELGWCKVYADDTAVILRKYCHD